MSKKQIEPLGEKALIVQFDNDQITHWHIRKQWFFKLFLIEKLGDQIEDIVMTSNAMTLFFKAPYSNYKQLNKHIKHWKAQSEEKPKPLAYKKWHIPICMDEVYSVDLLEYFKGDTSKVTAYQKDFLASTLIVHHYGFLPGFCYLSGLKKELQLPRKETPLLKVPKGAVAVGGSYAGIYPQESPGGWYIIGRTAVSMFDPLKETPTFANPGDSFIFSTLSKAEFLKAVSSKTKANTLPKYTTAYAQP